MHFEDIRFRVNQSEDAIFLVKRSRSWHGKRTLGLIKLFGNNQILYFVVNQADRDQRSTGDLLGLKNIRDSSLKGLYILAVQSVVK